MSEDGNSRQATSQTPVKSGSAVGAVTLPKGGGAIRGIGEKFGANPATGTGSMSIPIFTSPGRSGFGPKLSLSYDSGNANGAFGFGWSLSLPAVTRKTDKGLPQYLDSEESDTFILSGAEDLVPELKRNKDGTWLTRNGRHVYREYMRIRDNQTFRIKRYRPRIEGLFARIEQWTNVKTGEIHWRSISRENVTTLYGATKSSRISDPLSEPEISSTRTFSWLICASYDDKGNALIYEYVEENDIGVDLKLLCEQNRLRTANKYLKRIRYGNKQPNRILRTWEPFDPATLPNDEWMFEVVFDYGDGHYVESIQSDLTAAGHELDKIFASPKTSASWKVRPDPFISHRATFPILTYRRVERVLMFHHIPSTTESGPGYDGLVKSTDFHYHDLDYSHPVSIDQELAHEGSTRFASFIVAVTQSGYLQDKTRLPLVQNGESLCCYVRQSLPRLEFTYSKATMGNEIRMLNRGDLAHLPGGLDSSISQWVDLDGEGISGLLHEVNSGFFYTPNLGSGRFGPMQVLSRHPAATSFGNGKAQLLDLSGDGQLDVVEFAGPRPGFFERTVDKNWSTHRTFLSLPNIAWDDPNLRFVDLDGDGHADVLVTEHDAITWYPSLGEAGFGAARRVSRTSDKENTPHLVFADGTQAIYLADMSGDGLQDLCRITEHNVSFWSNLGHGRFGPKTTLDNSPWFDRPGQFDQRRIRLADVDGSGTTDIIYLGNETVRIYFNQSGNRLSDPKEVSLFPAIDNIATVQIADLLGNGTACLIWSSTLPDDVACPIRFVDLMGGTKPHLLTRAVNNLGAETEVRYVASTSFYLEDAANGRRWSTRLPFPVHVVDRVTTVDRISRTRFVSRYAYHEGAFDPVDREFRGFGLVEQWDTESTLSADTDPAATITNEETTSRVPPILARMWFHTGLPDPAGTASRHYASAYFGAPRQGDPDYAGAMERHLSTLLPDTILPKGLSERDYREACRALKGTMLRREVFALDGGELESIPYTVTEQNARVHQLQPHGENRHAVFLAHSSESVTYQYERQRDNPRITHEMTIEIDEFGNVVRSASIAYGRRVPESSLSPEIQIIQGRTSITGTINRLTVDHDTGNPAIDSDDDYRTPQICEVQTYELTGLPHSSGSDLLTIDGISNAWSAAVDLEYEKWNERPTSSHKRLIDCVRTIYRRNDLAGPLELGHLESMAIPYETYKVAFHRSMIELAFGVKLDSELLSIDAGYLRTPADDNWWIPSGRVYYSSDDLSSVVDELSFARRHFFLPHRSRDPFHTDTLNTEGTVCYDAHCLLIQETRDALGNRTSVGERNPDPLKPLRSVRHNYRVLQPELLMDPNDNRSEVCFDALGMVVGTAVMGKPQSAVAEGDTLADFTAILSTDAISQILADPASQFASDLLQGATTRIVYDLFAYSRTASSTAPQPPAVATFAREVHALDSSTRPQNKVYVSLAYSDGFGREILRKIQAEPGPVPIRNADNTIALDAGGLPRMSVANTENRWIASGWTVLNNKGKPVRQYEPFFTDTHRYEPDNRIGVTSILIYDPLDRIVATIHPNHSWEKVVFDAWRQETWDVNDTALIGDPATDSDVGGYFARQLRSDYIPTWYALRMDAAHSTLANQLWPDPSTLDDQRKAASKVAIHASTPTIMHVDPLGRTILTVAQLRTKFSDTRPMSQPESEFCTSQILFDIEGNQREVIDAKGRVVMRYEYDMLGNRIRRSSMEAGERWTLNDVLGKPLCTWNSRGNRVRVAYDALRRPVATYLQEASDTNEICISQVVYGESRDIPEASNTRGKVVETRDQAGIVYNDQYDFKGNLLSSRRRFARAYKETIDWSIAVPLQPDTFTNQTRFDALNRPIQFTAPHSDQPGARINIIQPAYSEANLLEAVHVWLGLLSAPTGILDPTTANFPAVLDINYDAKGQRTSITYGNGVISSYDYDPLTYRLTRLRTQRDPIRFPSDHSNIDPSNWLGLDVQNVSYTYDPAGNITQIRDDSQQAVYFANRRVDPSSEYTYDSLYRLIEATGREHLGQVAGPPLLHSHDDYARARLPHPGDGLVMGTYLERYVYDTLGNILSMQHLGNNPYSPGWTRTYQYNEASLLEPTKKNNRLSQTQVGNGRTAAPEKYFYDIPGNMLQMPHLWVMQWDHQDQLRMTQRQVVNEEDADGLQRNGEQTWYVYDSSGQRVRKITELATGQVKDDRVYIGGFEVYRRLGAAPLTRETLHIMDDKRRIAIVETRTQGSEPGVPAESRRFQFGNHLGSVSLELDENSQVVTYEEYTPYGSTAYQAVRSQTEASKRYRYTGKERDEESGFYYHGARYYAPWLGRWTSCDPAGTEDSLVLYQAVHNNPLNFSDPNGGESVGQLIESKALQSISGDHMAAGYMWTLLGVTWSAFGAEGLSKVVSDPKKASTGDYISAGIEVASVIPVAKLAKAGKGLFAAKEVIPEVTKQVTREIAPSATKQITKEVLPSATKEAAQESAPVIAEQIAKESAPVATKAAKESKDLFSVAKDALRTAEKSTAAPVQASSLGRIGTVSSRSGFRKELAKKLSEDTTHPLSFLLGPQGKLRPSTSKGITKEIWQEMPEIVEAGHAVSSKSLTGAAKGTDRFVVMSAANNRALSSTIEHSSKGGHMALDYALDIGGIPVHAQTAYDWVAKGLLSPEHLANARKILFK